MVAPHGRPQKVEAEQAPVLVIGVDEGAPGEDPVAGAVAKELARGVDLKEDGVVGDGLERDDVGAGGGGEEAQSGADAGSPEPLDHFAGSLHASLPCVGGESVLALQPSAQGRATG